MLYDCVKFFKGTFLIFEVQPKQKRGTSHCSCWWTSSVRSSCLHVVYAFVVKRGELFRFRRYVQFNALPEDRNALVLCLSFNCILLFLYVFFYLFLLCGKRQLGTTWVLKWPCLPGTAQLLQWSPLVWLITESRLIGVIRVIFQYFLRVCARVCVCCQFIPLCSVQLLKLLLNSVVSDSPARSLFSRLAGGSSERRCRWVIQNPAALIWVLQPAAVCLQRSSEREALWLMTQ